MNALMKTIGVAAALGVLSVAPMTGATAAPTSSTSPTSATSIATAPQNVITGVYGQDVLIAWQPPASNDGSPLKKYVVRKTLNGGWGSWESQETDAQTGHYHVWEDLHAGEKYYFSVIAVYESGHQAFSPAVFLSMPTGVPESVMSLSAKRVGTNHAEISWNAPKFTGGLPVTGYRMRVTTATHSYSTYLSATQTTALLTVVSTAGASSVTVWAMNEKGLGSPASVTV